MPRAVVPVMSVVNPVGVEHWHDLEDVFFAQGHRPRVSRPQEELEQPTDDERRLRLARVDPGADKDDLFVGELEGSDVERVGARLVGLEGFILGHLPWDPLVDNATRNVADIQI